MRTTKSRQRKKSQARRQAAPATSYVDYEVEGRSRAKSRSRIGRFIAHHGWVAKTSLQQLLQAPLSTLLTAAVIAIALSLPSGLFLLLNDLQTVVVGWQGTAQISVFLKKSAADNQAKSISVLLQNWDEISDVQYVSSDQALQEFQQHSGFGDALNILNENPLPAVLIIKPRQEYLTSKKLQPLTEKLRQLPEVDLVQLDYQWIERLNTIIALGKRGALLLSVMLAIAVLIVIGNTIRLTIYNRRQEILVTKLIGATNQFIRRPFLYTGFWYGVCGAILSILLISLLFWLISGPVKSLAGLYNSPFRLTGLTMRDAGLVFASAVGLGLVGSWIAVTRHIQLIEPK
ncbi:permease-like cell division protein FtsX [Kaarinaea lacus]